MLPRRSTNSTIASSKHYAKLPQNATSPGCESPAKNSLKPGSELIDEIMKKYLCQKAGQNASSCTLFSDCRGSVYSMDRRLQYWANILEDRKKIACRIQKVTGKRKSHVLYNQLEDHRNMQNVKRIMDFAQRLHPAKLITRKLYKNNDLIETLPRSERMQTNANLHIVGTPQVLQAEQLVGKCNVSGNSYIKSCYLHRKLRSQQHEIANVLEFYPDIDRLQVVGHRIHKHPRPAVDRISDFELSAFSSESNMESWARPEFPCCCIQLDDKILRTDAKLEKSMEYHLDFKCKPYESQTQALCKVENLGRKPVQMVWKKVQPIRCPAFVFNRSSFRLTYGGCENIEIMFMSTQRMTCEEQWWLQTDPDFFEEPHKILVKLSAECYIPEKYFSTMIKDILDSVLCTVIPGRGCGAQRKSVLSEKELFDNRNPGFHCEYDDLLKFKEIYRQIKDKSHPPSWDLTLQTLKQLIEGTQDYIQRSIYMDVFMGTIRDMRRRLPDCDSNIKALLARDVILSHLDKWDAKAGKILYTVARSDVDALVIRMPFDFVVEELKQCRTDKEKKTTIQHNALFIQMYCCVCDFVEDIVLFMENCLLLHSSS